MDSFRGIWRDVTYTLSVNDLRLDYHGASSKTCHNRNILKNEYPLLRFDLQSLYMKYKIDQEDRQA